MVVPTKLIRPTIEVPEIVEISGQDKLVAVQVRTALENTSDHDVVLHAPSKEDEVFLHVLDDNRREIARVQPASESSDPSGVESFRSVTIAAGHSTHETQTISIDARKLKDGRKYSIRGEIFGQIAEAVFTVVAPKHQAASSSKKTTYAGTAKRTSKTKKKA